VSESNRTFVGFGFGAIQAGLFLYEAARSGNFGRLVVGEVVPAAVDELVKAGGRYVVNIASSDGVKPEEVGPVEILHTGSEHGRALLVNAVAEAEEIATAAPGVQQYVSNASGSLHGILADGLRKKAAARGPRAVVYAAENHNHAAEILEAAVLDAVPADERGSVRRQVRFLNTVIGKMSGVVSGEGEVHSRGLAPITPGAGRAFLVERFNRIYISRIRFDGGANAGFRRGIDLFEEKPDLLPFEEAKLYGHNATHALAAYVAAVRGLERMCELAGDPGVVAFLEAAFIEESGATLIRRHAGLGPLFTREGYRAYALDLLTRMFNPHLGDLVSRVGRDPQRKLGWDDRLIGTIRLATAYGVEPRRYAMGAAAALAMLDGSVLRADSPSVSALLDPLWREARPDAAEAQEVIRLVEDGRNRLRLWVERGFPDLGAFPACC
jgi:mannitol-1-phosphate 5-dehydrogenase